MKMQKTKNIEQRIIKSVFSYFSFVLTFLLYALCPMLYAGTASTSANFLLENLSAREVAMGGLFTATAEGTDAIYSNPVGLAQTQYPEINLSYASTQDESMYSFLGYIHPISKKSGLRMGIGIGITYYTTGNMDVNYLDGTTKSFNAEKGYSVPLSFGLKYKLFGVGISPKFIRSTLVEQYTATSYAADIGMMIFPLTGSWRERLVIGAATQNLGNKISYKTVQYDLPRTDSIGISLRFMDHDDYGSILASAQAERTIGEIERYRLGGEYGIGIQDEERHFFLRGGYRIHFDNEDFSIGIGIREKNLQLDYAYVNANELEKTHKVTLLFRFGKFSDKKKDDYAMKDLRKSMQKKENLELLETEFKSSQKNAVNDTDYQLIKPPKK